jgi:hypothetical protein
MTRIEEAFIDQVSEWSARKPFCVFVRKPVPKGTHMREVGRQPAKAAFEVKKGIRQVMTLSEADVEKYLDPS